MDIRIFQPETRVNVGGDFVIRLQDVLDVDIYEIVERVNVLLHQTLDFEERRQ